MPKAAAFRRSQKIATVEIPIKPVPASRPRVSRWGTYYLKTYRNWRTEAQKLIPPGTLHEEGPLMVVCEFALDKPRTSKLNYPHPDLDNFQKASLDAITKVGGYWKDDKQIVELIGVKRWTYVGEQPRSIVEIYKCDALESKM